MATLNIKTIFFLQFIFLITNIDLSIAQSKKAKMSIEIINPKHLRLRDTITMRIKNNSNLILWYVVTKQGWTGKDWLTSVLDIRNPISDTQKFKLLKPKESDRIRIALTSIIILPNKYLKTQNVFGPYRFNLCYSHSLGRQPMFNPSMSFLVSK